MEVSVALSLSAAHFALASLHVKAYVSGIR